MSKHFGESSHFLNFPLCVSPRDEMFAMRKKIKTIKNLKEHLLYRLANEYEEMFVCCE